MTDKQGSELPWKERVPMLSINPEAATRDDVVSLAVELIIANHKVTRAREAEMWADRMAVFIQDGVKSYPGGGLRIDEWVNEKRSILSGYDAWKEGWTRRDGEHFCPSCKEKKEASDVA